MNAIDRDQSDWTDRGALLLVAAAAILMGLPTLRGGFVGGDDHRLLLNHVLVNQPSFSHALELFTIFHRDLYQPLPLLSFSAEFAIADVFGLFDRSIESGAWLFHLSNIVLHAVNALLVWWLVALLQKPVDNSEHECTTTPAPVGHTAQTVRTIATLAALLFAIHPLQMEVIAWTNGRMMLMSTMFGIASMIALARWLDHRKLGLAVLTVALVVCCAMSKVRIGLPILLAIVPLARRVKVSQGVIALWGVCTAAMAVFAYINIQATVGADLFALGAEHLGGPSIVRVLMALAWYFQHFLWPSGLASYYPTPPTVDWSHAINARVIGILVVAGVVIAWASWRSLVARLGFLWFFATIASTLPFVPARNILAADRYMYLPIIGLAWLLAVLAHQGYDRWHAHRLRGIGKSVLAVIGAVLVTSMIATGWHVAPYYENSLSKTSRITQLFPDTPRVWEKLGWCCYSQGDYETAIEHARKEFKHDAPTVRSGATQLMGMAYLRMGDGERALELLHKGIAIDPASAVGKYRLAVAYTKLGRTDEAIKYFEMAVEAAPLHNPTINGLASVYRSVGRNDDARRMYDKALANNEYEVPAHMGLAEMDILRGTPESLHAASVRLAKMLDWMPKNAEALGLLAWSLALSGDLQAAEIQCDQRIRNVRTTPLITATRAYIALNRGRFASAAAATESLCTVGYEADGARAQLKGALERFDREHPGVPWTFCLVARLLLTEGNLDGATVSLRLCHERCTDEACRRQVHKLMTDIGAAKVSPLLSP